MTMRRLGLFAALAVVASVLAVPVVVSAVEVGANDFRISDMGPDGNPAFRAQNPAVAYNSVNDRFLVVWSGDDTTDGENEIFGQLLGSDGSEIGPDFRVSDMGPDGSTLYRAERAAVVYNPDRNEFLVVWSGDDNTPPLVDGEFEVFGQRLNGATGAEIGGDFRISDMGPDGNATYFVDSPTVTYNPDAKQYLVVWSGTDNTPPFVAGEYEVFGQRLDGATGAEIGGDFRISDMGPDGNPSYGAATPAVAYNPDAKQYLVVWSGADNTGLLVAEELEIFGQRLDGATGAEVGGDFRISDMGPDGNFLYRASSPAVAYNSGAQQYLVVWWGDDDTPPLVDGEFEIFGQRLDGATGAEIGGDFRVSHMGPDGNISYGAFYPGVAYNPDRNEYLVVWDGEDDTSPLVEDEFEIFGQRLNGPTGAGIGGDFRISDMGPDGDPAYDAYAPAVVYNPSGEQYLIAWYGDDDTPPLVDNEFEIFGQLWETPAAPFVGETVGLVDPSQGRWHLRNSAGVVSSFFYGNPGDFPVMGDWNCDGVDTPGMYRQSDGFVYLRNSNTQGIGDIRFFFGNPGDVPIVGDFNNNGCDTVGIYRPSEGRFFVINQLGANEGGLGAAELDYLFGDPGDKPFIGDFDGDGVDTVGLHRESTGFVYFRNSHTQGIADSQFFFGDPGDRLVAGDWGVVDGVDTPGVFRPSNTTFFFRHTNTQGNADATLVFGESPWLPVAGTFGLD
jgi:hypothetical protein